MSAAPHGLARERLFRFMTVGVGAALLFFLLSFVLVSFGLSPFTGSVIAYGVAFVAAYCAQRGWTFGGVHDHGRALPRYLALQLCCAGFSGLVAHIAVTRFGLSPLAMSASTSLAASAASYIASTLWVFPAHE